MGDQKEGAPSDCSGEQHGQVKEGDAELNASEVCVVVKRATVSLDHKSGTREPRRLTISGRWWWSEVESLLGRGVGDREGAFGYGRGPFGRARRRLGLSLSWTFQKLNSLIATPSLVLLDRKDQPTHGSN